MTDKKFSELAVNDRFFVNGIEYVKTETVRISCCQSINAMVVDNASAKSFFAEDAVVQVNA